MAGKTDQSRGAAEGTDLVELLPRVERALRALAADVIMPSFQKVTHEHKPDGSLLTAADLAAQHYLTEALQRILPLPILGEEMREDQQEAAFAAGGKGLWCFDPIDGTTNFLVGMPFFATSVALLIDGRAVLGATYAPISNEMFTAVTGCGACLNGESLPLRKSSADLARAVALVDLKRLPRPLAARLGDTPPYYSQRNLGSSVLEWCYLAAGRADILLHGGQRLWDYAAGALMLREAGGRIAALEADDFESLDPWRRSVLATLNPELLTAWCEWIRS